MFTICNLDDDDYHAKLLVAMHICSHATAREQSSIFKRLLELWESEFGSQSTLVNI